MIIFQSNRYQVAVFLHIAINIWLFNSEMLGYFLQGIQLLRSDFNITVCEIIQLFYYYRIIFFICFIDNSYFLRLIFLVRFNWNFLCCFILGQLWLQTLKFNMYIEMGCRCLFVIIIVILFNFVDPKGRFRNFINLFFDPFY